MKQNKQKFFIIILAVFIVIIMIMVRFYLQLENFETTPPSIVFITAIYGNYELSCKKYVPQTIPCDFICFTNNKDIIGNGWEIDMTPYHIENKSPIDDDSMINSFSKNNNNFNIAKYYKEAFINIPRLKSYDIVVWLDGTVEVTNEDFCKMIAENIENSGIVTLSHERKGLLFKEVLASSDGSKYTSTYFNGEQPYQDVFKQYVNYLNEGYTETFFDEMKNLSGNENYGLWITCFVAFRQKDNKIREFLDLWFLQNLKYTTQDQISFSFCCQQKKIFPYTLKFDTLEKKEFFIKHGHGK